MPPKPRSLLFDEAQRVGLGGCHFTGDELPYSCLAASAGFAPNSGNSQTDPRAVMLRSVLRTIAELSHMGLT